MKYTGSCHCGNVRYEVNTEIGKLLTCNCSICQKKGSALHFVPEIDFKLLSGENAFKDYQFNKNIIHHLFCTNCGISSFSRGVGPDGVKMIAINARCLDNFDLQKAETFLYDGKSM